MTDYMEYEIKDSLPPQHLLSLPRPDVLLGRPNGAPDTTTLAAHDFDLDNRSGFLPPQPPLERLPSMWEPWEIILDKGKNGALQLGSKIDDGPKSQYSASWRQSVQEMILLRIDGLKCSEIMLRRAHLVLTNVTHLYIHSLPDTAQIIIPESIAIPLLQVSQQLVIPPVLTYSDNVLYNWDVISPSTDPTPSMDNIRSQTTMTGTKDEEVFLLTSTRIEIQGVKALEAMRSIMDEIFVGDDLAIQRITASLHSLALGIQEMRTLLLSVKNGCRTDVFYNEIRPWLRGADPNVRPWSFESLEKYPELEYPEKLAGSSAGQSALIHAMDIFLGMDDTSANGNASTSSLSLLEEMRNYMPRHHRHFLNHLKKTPYLLREMVDSSGNSGLLRGYNSAIKAMKEFRDAHLIIVTLFIIGPARKAKTAQQTTSGPLKGTGGTDLVKFLKGVRDRTTRSILSESE